MFKKLINLTLTERQREKQRDYQNVVINQIIIITLGLTLSEFIINGASTLPGKFVLTIFLFFGTLYSFLLWDLLRNFTSNQLLLNTFLIILIGIVIIGVLGEFPFYKIIDIKDRQLFYMALHGPYFPIEITIIGFAIRDIFSGQYLTSDKLWGSACVFLMIGLSFGSLYHLLCIIKPDSLGETMELGFANYSECITYSLSILGGMDPGHPNAARIIRNISVLEALWSNLFVVLIIGKLMGLPRPPKPDSESTD